MILDIYSRYVPGWLLAPREDARLAEKLLADTIVKQNVGHGQLAVHADRGSSMASKPVRSSSLTSESPSPTPDRTSPMTTPSPRRSSRR